MSEEELSNYCEIFVWCRKCGHKHRIGTIINSKHSNKCQLIPKVCDDEKDHCWKYLGYIFEGIYTILNEEYIRVSVKNAENFEGNWKTYLVIGEVEIFQCIVCRKQKKEIGSLANKNQMERKLSSGRIDPDLQTKEQIQLLLCELNTILGIE